MWGEKISSSLCRCTFRLSISWGSWYWRANQLKHHQALHQQRYLMWMLRSALWIMLRLKQSRSFSENPWHLFHARVLTLRDNKGKRVTNPHGEPVLIIREFFMLSTSQQEDLGSQGITRHVWERFPLAGHSVFFSTRSWEIGRMTAYVKNYSTDEEKETYQQKPRYYENVGWRREVS